MWRHKDDPTIIIIKDYIFQELRVLGRPSTYNIIILLIIPFVPQAPSVGNPIIIPPK